MAENSRGIGAGARTVATGERSAAGAVGNERGERGSKNRGRSLIEHTSLPRHQFTLEQIQFCVEHLLLSARTGFRAASRVVDAIVYFFGINWEVPQTTTTRTWLLRIALFQLTRSKTKADDWIWLVDHTVQIGQEKCLVVLGVRQSELPPQGTCLLLEHLQLLALLPVTHSDKHVVHQQLEATIAETGVPRAILGDHGGDLQGGVNLFCSQHSETSSVYDIAHKAARLLRKRLETDERWKSFCTCVGQTKFKTQQTEWAFLVPPTQRSKARYMNLEPLLGWARRTLQVLDEQPASVLQHGSIEKLEEKFGWLRTYRDELAQWLEYLELTDQAVDEVRRYGYQMGAAVRLAVRLQSQVRTELGEELADELVAFVSEESASARPGERLPGSSEVLESSLGKLKSFEGDHQKGGFTSLLLSLGALVGHLDAATIRDALLHVPYKQVTQWVHQHLGTTFQAKRCIVSQATRAINPA
jgi:hypothetical protein